MKKFNIQCTYCDKALSGVSRIPFGWLSGSMRTDLMGSVRYDQTPILCPFHVLQMYIIVESVKYEAAAVMGVDLLHGVADYSEEEMQQFAEERFVELEYKEHLIK